MLRQHKSRVGLADSRRRLHRSRPERLHQQWIIEFFLEFFAVYCVGLFFSFFTAKSQWSYNHSRGIWPKVKPLSFHSYNMTLTTYCSPYLRSTVARTYIFLANTYIYTPYTGPVTIRSKDDIWPRLFKEVLFALTVYMKCIKLLVYRVICLLGTLQK